jgi:hypothetical protein
MEERIKASYHGFTLLADREHGGPRGWSARVLDRNGCQLVDDRPGPWLSVSEAQERAEELAKDEIVRLGEHRPTDRPNWYSH